MKRNETANNPDEEFELPEKFHKLEKFFEDLKTDFGQRCIFDDLATESVLDIFILATRAASRRKGVGLNLITRALEDAREEGVSAVCTMGLSIFSQKIFHRLQFSPEVEIEFKDYRQEDNVVFNIEPMGIHKSGIFFTLKLGD